MTLTPTAKIAARLDEADDVAAAERVLGDATIYDLREIAKARLLSPLGHRSDVVNTLLGERFGYPAASSTRRALAAAAAEHGWDATDGGGADPWRVSVTLRKPGRRVFVLFGGRGRISHLSIHYDPTNSHRTVPRGKLAAALEELAR